MTSPAQGQYLVYERGPNPGDEVHLSCHRGPGALGPYTSNYCHLTYVKGGIRYHMGYNASQYENIQVVRYHPNQEYKHHYDICHPIQGHAEHLKTCKQDYKKYNSLRYATILFYLNDGYEGGETYFPKLNKKIKPKKGKALIFFNCNLNKDTKNNGLCDVIYNSEHAGLPVKVSKNTNQSNEKWIANVWIRTKSI